MRGKSYFGKVCLCGRTSVLTVSGDGLLSSAWYGSRHTFTRGLNALSLGRKRDGKVLAASVDFHCLQLKTTVILKWSILGVAYPDPLH